MRSTHPLLRAIKPWSQGYRACILLAVSVTMLVIVAQRQGEWQALELRAFDRMLLARGAAAADDRIVIIGETEDDIRHYGHPLSDQVMADALDTLEQAGARVIGVDKYRDRPVAPGSERLEQVLQQHQNIVWIFFVGKSLGDSVQVPRILAGNPERSGFNDIVEDADGVVRRGLLFMDVDQQSYYAFPLLLSLHYLAGEHIFAQSDARGFVSLNGISLSPIDSEFGGYRQVDARGYQIMLEYPRLPHTFSSFSLSQLLQGDIPATALRGKVVLLGATASSLLDNRLLPNQLQRSGVEYHGHVVSQLLDSALQHKPPLRSLSDTSEQIGLLVTCLMGAFTGFWRGSLWRLSLLLMIESTALVLLSLGALALGWWLPVVAPLLAWLAALAVSVLYFANLERTERRQLMQLFASHVSPEVASKLWSAREQFFDEGGVRPDTLQATVLFTDLCDFTQTAENMEPLVLMCWLNEYMEDMSGLVMRHGGIVNKYIGDAVMAMFGVPVKRNNEHEIADDARHAIECALAFDEDLRALNQRWQARHLPVMTMRAGIFTGPLVAGSFGGSLRMEYTVIGDTVNIASRLESFDKTIAIPTAEHPCRILVGESTYRLLGERFQAQLIGEFTLKGKTQPIKIYQILGMA